MQPDLISLEITKGELRRLIGFRPDYVLRPPILKDPNEIIISLTMSLIIVGLIYGFIVLPLIGSSLTVGITLFIVVFITILVGRSLWRLVKYPKLLRILLNLVEKYHLILAETDTHDEVTDFEQGQNYTSNRSTLIVALQLVREDLVHAFHRERHLRDHKKSLVRNQESFVSNLPNLQTLEVSNQDEYSKLLDKVLQIAEDVQAQLSKTVLKSKIK